MLLTEGLKTRALSEKSNYRRNVSVSTKASGSSSETEAAAEAAAMTVESSSEGYKMRNSVVENRGRQRESMMDAHSESQQASSINGSNNAFTNMERI